MSAELKASIESKLTAAQGFPTIELESKTDASLIGGFVLEFNNNLVDASILHDLKIVKQQFLQNHFVEKI